MKLINEITNNICYLYNNVGDISMLDYIDKLDIKDNKLQYLLKDMFTLNDTMLDTDIYYANRREFLYYLGFDWDTKSGDLVYVGNGIEYEIDYIVFVLGRDLIKGVIPSENDLAYELCTEVATDFYKSRYNVNTKGLYECLEEYIKDSFYLDGGKLTWKGREL